MGIILKFNSMKIVECFIEGLKIIKLNSFNDHRGNFIKIFNNDFFLKAGIDFKIKESYYTISKKNVIRGMHFQTPPFEHNKMVYVNQGSIVDVIVDLRKKSGTYGKFFSTEINNKNLSAIYIPSGCAHGFLSLEDNTMITYLQSSIYNAECDDGIRYDSFGFNWGVLKPVISDRDLAFQKLQNFSSKF